MLDAKVNIKMAQWIITRIRMEEEGGELVVTFRSKRHDALDKPMPPEAVPLMTDLFQNGAHALSAEESVPCLDYVKRNGLARPTETVVEQRNEPIGLTPTGRLVMMVVCANQVTEWI